MALGMSDNQFSSFSFVHSYSFYMIIYDILFMNIKLKTLQHSPVWQRHYFSSDDVITNYWPIDTIWFLSDSRYAILTIDIIRALSNYRFERKVDQKRSYISIIFC